MARMLELKRKPEVVLWVFVFPLLLATGLGIAFCNKPDDASTVAIVSGAGAQQASFKIDVLGGEVAWKGFRYGFERCAAGQHSGRDAADPSVAALAGDVCVGWYLVCAGPKVV